MPGGGRGYLLLPVFVALALFWIAYDDGGYDLTSRNTIGVAAAWAIVLGLGLRLWPRARIPAAALVAGSFLVAFAAWTGLSLLWGESAEAQLAEFDRVALYLGVFALVVLVSPSGRTARRFALGIAVGA